MIRIFLCGALLKVAIKGFTTLRYLYKQTVYIISLEVHDELSHESKFQNAQGWYHDATLFYFNLMVDRGLEQNTQGLCS